MGAGHNRQFSAEARADRMGLNLRHRYAPAFVVATMVMVSMIMCGQNNIHGWVADIIMVLDSLALVMVAAWCGFVEVMRHFA